MAMILLAVANVAVADAADGPVALGDCAHQLSPGGVRACRVGGMHCHIAGAKRVHRRDFEAVWVGVADVVRIHPAKRPRTPHDHAMRRDRAAAAAGASPGRESRVSRERRTRPGRKDARESRRNRSASLANAVQYS